MVGTTSRPGRRPPGATDRWRWLAAFAVLFAVVVGVLVADRRTPSTSAAATTTSPIGGDGDPGGARDPGRSRAEERQLLLPEGLDGTLYLLGEDSTITEIDLASGRLRRVPLDFEVASWLAPQVVALDEVLLISTRRRVYSLDRATLGGAEVLAEDRWVVAPADGSWAALVPYGGAEGTVVLLDGRGSPRPGGSLRLSSGVTVQGATATALLLDTAGTLRLWGIDGSAGHALGTGRYLGSGDDAVARIACDESSCALHLGPTAQPDTVVVDAPPLAGAWYFGAGAALAPDGSALAFYEPARGGADHVVRVLEAGPGDETARRWSTSPIAASAPGPLPALAFTPDGSAVVHPSPDGVVIWPLPGPNATHAVEMALPVGVTLALTVAPQPPPPPSSGPPPSFV